jgi:NTP pyrophosphatase (non-canonical NTP hydrolase)
MDFYARRCRRIAADHGFTCPDYIMGELDPEEVRRGEISLTDMTLSKLALVHSEVSEMVEAARKGDFEGFQEEMADVFIRLFDMAGAMNIDVEHHIQEKMRKNEARPFKHGKLA